MIYFARVGSRPDSPIKIGRTIQLRRRIKQLEDQYGVEIIVLGVRDGGPNEERQHHQKFDLIRLNKAHCKGSLEHFRPTRELIDYIRDECRQPDLLDSLGEKERTVPIRLDLRADVHHLLRMVAAHHGMSMTAYAKQILTTKIKEEAKRKGFI